MPTTTTVAVYCRISKDPSRLEVGVNRQRQDCVALANDLWPQCDVRLFIDNDLSVADPAVARPQWQAMLDALRSGEIDRIVAYDQSRLTRQPIEWEQLLVILGRRGIGSVQTVREGERDVAEGGGRMVTRIMAAVDAEYTEVTPGAHSPGDAPARCRGPALRRATVRLRLGGGRRRTQDTGHRAP